MIRDYRYPCNNRIINSGSTTNVKVMFHRYRAGLDQQVNLGVILDEND